MDPIVDIQLFTDPACPFAWSAEPSRFRLKWLYGDQLDWHQRMVVLSEDPAELEKKGLTPEMLSRGARQLADAYGMPIVTDAPSRLSSSVDACRAAVAARLHQPESEDALIRRLRVKAMSRHPLDDPTTIADAASEAGIDPDALQEWVSDPAVEEALRADMAAARSPLPAALALDHKLAAAGDGRRYTCPSYETTNIATGTQLVAAGFWPTAVYEVLLANTAPQLERRADPETVDEVLNWAGEPLATAEVAEVMGISIDDARAALRDIAQPTEMGTDALWELDAALSPA